MYICKYEYQTLSSFIKKYGRFPSSKFPSLDGELELGKWYDCQKYNGSNRGNRIPGFSMSGVMEWDNMCLDVIIFVQKRHRFPFDNTGDAQENKISTWLIAQLHNISRQDVCKVIQRRITYMKYNSEWGHLISLLLRIDLSGPVSRFWNLYKTFPSPKSSNYKLRELNNWIKWQKRLYRAGLIDSGIKARLEKIPCWTWNPKPHWDVMYDLAINHDRAINVSVYLKQWIDKQSKKETVTMEKKILLEKIPGWKWSRNPRILTK